MSDHRVDVIALMDNGQTVTCPWVRNWEYREAHEGYHPAQWVIKLDPEHLDTGSSSYRLFTASRVLSIGPMVYQADNGEPNDA